MKKLVGITESEYKLKDDPEVSFTLKPLTAAQRIDIMYRMTDEKKYGQAMQDACEYAIKAWQGLKDDTNEAIDFAIAEVKRLPVEVLIEVANHILAISAVGEQEKKVSGSASPSAETQKV